MTDRYTSGLSRVLVLLPVLSLALGALAWLRYGMDLPWFDDWRGYAEGNIGSLNPGYLFRAVNDTLAPVGFALDALAQRFLGGNSVAYQFLSMTIVLGSLLILQWRLLVRALENRLQAAGCFSLALLMLQPGSYWGLENLAYHQCLPLVFILSAMWLIACSEKLRTWHLLLIPLLGLVAGFTYISGAFGAFTAGVAMLVTGYLFQHGEARTRILRGAWLFTIAGTITVGCQFYFSLLKFSSVGTHAGIPMALPYEADFWMFFLGKVGRSLLLPPAHPGASLAIVGLAILLAVAVAVALFRRASANDATPQDKRIATLYLTFGAVIFVYMMLVAAGRANYRDPQITGLLDIFSVGFIRFHFFWATLLWPWVAAGIVWVARTKSWAGQPGVRWGGLASVFVLVSAMVWGGAYEHMEEQREIAASRLPAARCLLEELQKGGEVRCPGLVPARFTDQTPDAYPAYVNAQKMHASFIRYFPILEGSRRREDMRPFYGSTVDGEGPVLSQMKKSGIDSYQATGDDPQWQFRTGQPQTMGRCTTIDVDVTMRAEISDIVQIYYRPAGQPAFSEELSIQHPLREGSADRTLTFRLQSAIGFEDALRVDPATRPQRLVIKSIQVFCVRQKP